MMGDRIRNLRKILKHIKIGSVIFVLAVLFVTAGIATYVGLRIHDMRKETVLLRGEVNTQDTAMEYNRYLLTRVDIVTMVSSKVEDLLESGADSGVIEEYLTDQTNIIIDTLDPETTGLYGLFNGVYVDGAGWVPDADFVPTERPWYTQTLNSNRRITFVEPYLDAQTNTVMLTVSALLRDGQSVLAMDVSLRPIQEMVEKVTSASAGEQAFLLDEAGSVIAHSDISQVGRNYMEEPESLGGIIAHRLLEQGRMQFEVSTPEGNYTVYIHDLEGGWYSISLIDSDAWHRPMHRTMIVFAVILGAVLLAIVIVFLHLTAKNAALQELHHRVDLEEKKGEELQALSETDRMTGLKDRVSGEQKVNELIRAGSGGMFLELDVDHFKEINDTYGHQTGDNVIHAVADAMRNTFRTNDIIMRLGGDEFGVFAVGIANREMGEGMIRRLFSRIDTMDIQGIRGGKVCVSVGAVISQDGRDTSFQALYAVTDVALYHSKETPGNSLTFG